MEEGVGEKKRRREWEGEKGDEEKVDSEEKKTKREKIKLTVELARPGARAEENEQEREEDAEAAVDGLVLAMREEEEGRAGEVRWEEDDEDKVERAIRERREKKKTRERQEKREERSFFFSRVESGSDYCLVAPPKTPAAYSTECYTLERERKGPKMTRSTSGSPRQLRVFVWKAFCKGTLMSLRVILSRPHYLPKL